MNYLENWIDPSKISMTGWGGTKEYDIENHHLELIAKNGWQSFFWTSPDIVNKRIVFEFDYKFTNLDNWSDSYMINSNDYGSGKGLLKTTEWKHFCSEITSKTQYIGVNVRGEDNTGKSLALAIKNVRLYPSNSFNNQFCKTGICKSTELIEDNSFTLYQSSIYCSDIIEN